MTGGRAGGGSGGGSFLAHPGTIIAGTHCKPAQLHRTVQDHENQARVIELLMLLGDASL